MQIFINNTNKVICPQDFICIDKGYYRNIFLSKKEYDYDFFNKTPRNLQQISDLICADFISSDICEDVMVGGSVIYQGATPKSDIDFLGIKRGVKNSRYIFKVRILEKVWTGEVTINNGNDGRHLWFRYEEKPTNPKYFIVLSPKCWAFFSADVFGGTTMMYNLAQIDAFEMLGGLLCIFLYNHNGKEYYITSQELTDKLRTELITTVRKRLFVKSRWERGLRQNCIKLFADTLDRAPFWAEKQSDGRYLIKPTNGIISRKHLYSRWENMKKFFDFSYMGYLIYSRRYEKLMKLIK